MRQDHRPKSTNASAHNKNTELVVLAKQVELLLAVFKVMCAVDSEEAKSLSFQELTETVWKNTVQLYGLDELV